MIFITKLNDVYQLVLQKCSLLQLVGNLDTKSNSKNRLTNIKNRNSIYRKKSFDSNTLVAFKFDRQLHGKWNWSSYLQ